LVRGFGAEAQRAEDLFEVVIVGNAKNRRHEKLPDYKQRNEYAKGQIDAISPMDCQRQYVIYLHLPENGDEGNR
jgi:hypothetical protein